MNLSLHLMSALQRYMAQTFVFMILFSLREILSASSVLSVVQKDKLERMQRAQRWAHPIRPRMEGMVKSAGAFCGFQMLLR
jgi:hypothetical protein